MTASPNYDLIVSWLDILDSSSYYELLGLLEIADDDAIQNAFHTFSKSFHPDRHRAAPENIQKAVAKIYSRGAEAYGILRREVSRQAYDLALSQGVLRLTPGKARPQVLRTSESLESACKTPGGRLHARQLERALSENKWEEARHLLRKALLSENLNEELEKRYHALLQLAGVAHDKSQR